MGRSGQTSTLEVAILGCGPKGLFALERLLDHLAAAPPGTSVDVHVFDPTPVPGAGPNYDPGGPEYLRMNFAASEVDMWWPDGRAVPAGEQRSFAAWRQSAAGRPEADGYPPRAQVGRYLAEGHALLLRHAPANVDITTWPSAATDVRRRGRRWEVLAGEWRGPYDELLIATGHERPSQTSVAPAWSHAAPLIPAVFPVSTWLSRERIAPRASVAVRGFALTFLDAALALTEGRGGRFEALEHPYRLHYTPGEDDVGLILPFSRTGRPMLAKPPPGLAADIRGLEEIAEHGRAWILALRDQVDLHADLLPVIAASAASSLCAAGGHARRGEPLRGEEVAANAWLTAAAGGTPPPADVGPRDEVERSLAVAAGVGPPGRQWALGHAWRSLYPALVARLGGDGLADADWPGFRALASAMERVSFGPPAVNAAKLLALVDVGRIDPTHIAGGRIVTDGGLTCLRSPQGRQSVDVVLDAVLPAPGANGLHGSLVERLVVDGHARVAAGRRGLEVDADGACRGPRGARTPGLSAIGRPTEDSVIGNDTLSRKLHPLADHWARRIADRCREGAVTGSETVEGRAPA